MAVGPGKYDDACTVARESTGADAVVLIVLGGEHGAGFSVQAVHPAFCEVLPALLEDLAREIRGGAIQ